MNKYLKNALLFVRKKLLYDPIDYFFGKAGFRVSRLKPKPKVVHKVNPEFTIEVYARSKDMVIDRVSDMTNVTNRLIRHLREVGCFVQLIEASHTAETRIAFKRGDLAFVVNAMNSFNDEGLSVFFLQNPRKYGHTRLIPFYFKSAGKIYNQRDLTLDPWIEGEDRIFTHTPNPFMCSIPSFYINRTVSALHPYDLKGDASRDISMRSMLGVDESIEQNFGFPIDVVYTWVNGEDPDWAEKKGERELEFHIHHENTGVSRYRSINELRYSLRSIVNFAPFVRHIYIVTDNQVPDWLDTTHPKITVVDHKEIISAAGALPTFNSHAIEANLHRIPGLAEHFLYVNDDVMFWNRISPSDFFHANGLSRSFLENLPNVYGPVLHQTPAWRAAALNANKLLKQKFGRTLNSHHLHTPFALRKSIAEGMWEAFPDELERVSRSPFRSNEDISPISFLYHGYSFAVGASTFDTIAETRMSLGAADFSGQIARSLSNRRTKVVCINDNHTEHYDGNLSAFYHAMSVKFPIAVSWELDR